jgi:hypothetical protein
MGPIVKSLIKRDGSKTPTHICGPLRLKYQPQEKATTIAVCLEDQFTPHDLCDENHKQRVEAGVQTLLEAADDTPFEK